MTEKEYRESMTVHTAELLPFETNRFSPPGNRHLYMFARKRRPEDNPVDVLKDMPAEDPQLAEKRRKFAEKYVGAIYDFEKAEEVAVCNAIGESAISHFWSHYRQNPDEYSTITLLSDSNCRYEYQLTLVDDVMVLRVFKYHPYKSRKDTPQGGFEVKRFCIRKDVRWIETYKGQIVSYQFKCDSAEWFNNINCANCSIEDAEKIADLFGHNLPGSCHFADSSTTVLRIAYYFTRIYIQEHLTARIFSNIPAAIRDDLDEPAQERITYSFESGSHRYFVSEYHDENNIITRLYADESHIWQIGYNRFRKAWTSVQKATTSFTRTDLFHIMGCRRMKTGTVLDRFDSRDTVNTIRACLAYPALEKLYRAGYYRIIYAIEAKFLPKHIFNALNLTGDTAKTNISLADIFHTTPGCVKYIPKHIRPEEAGSYISLIPDERVAEAVPDMKTRIKAISLYLRTDLKYIMDEYNLDRYLSPGEDKEVFRFFGKLARKQDSISNEQMDAHLTEYYDYIRCRPNAIAYSRHLAENNYETFSYPVCPKISALKFLHDKAYRDCIYYRNMEKSEKAARNDEQIKTFTDSADYRDLLYENSDYAVLPVKKAQDLLDEGAYLHHCVGSYVEEVAEKRSYIYFLRKKKALDTPYFTIELKKSVPEDIKRMTQCYTSHDSTEKTESCRRFLKEWAAAKKFTIACHI